MAASPSANEAQATARRLGQLLGRCSPVSGLKSLGDLLAHFEGQDRHVRGLIDAERPEMFGWEASAAPPTPDTPPETHLPDDVPVSAGVCRCWAAKRARARHQPSHALSAPNPPILVQIAPTRPPAHWRSRQDLNLRPPD